MYKIPGDTWSEGYIAYENGAHRLSNPYDQDKEPNEYANWQAGWDDAADQDNPF